MIRRYIMPACLIAGLTMMISAFSTASAPSESPKETAATVDNSIQSAATVAQSVPQETESNTTSASSTSNSSGEVQEKKISKSGGLGDTLKIFEDNYGPKTGDGMMVSFKDGYITPMFFGERTNNVTMSFESTNTPRRTKDEALQLVTDIIPVDAKQIKRWKVEEGKDAILYSSKSLAEVLGKDEFGSAKPGTFIVLLKYDKQGVYAVIVATGDKS